MLFRSNTTLLLRQGEPRAEPERVFEAGGAAEAGRALRRLGGSLAGVGRRRGRLGRHQPNPHQERLAVSQSSAQV